MENEGDKIAVARQLAVLQHRADRTDHAIEKITEYLKELTASQTLLVKLQTQRAEDTTRIARLERKLDTVDEKRRAQHAETEEWTRRGTGLSALNASWIDWFKTVLVATISAVVGVGATLLATKGVPL